MNAGQVNTPAHLIFAAAAFARPAEDGRARRCNLAAAAGGLAPDLALFGLIFFARFVQGRELHQIFKEDYLSPLWQGIFRVDNSIPLWALLTVVALWRRWTALAVFGGAGLLHLAFDLPLHGSDARPHFGPLSDWVFRSPISYWDPAAYGGTVAVVEGGVCVILAAVLLRRFRGWPARLLILGALVAEAAPTLMWPLLLG